jgi:hypothetical protein
MDIMPGGIPYPTAKQLGILFDGCMSIMVVPDKDRLYAEWRTRVY